MACTQVLTSHSCTDHSNSMCYSSLSAGTCCLRYDMSPTKKAETYFYAQCFSVVWIILLYWPQKNQLLQHCQVVLPVVQKDPEIPKFMSGSQKNIPELTGVLTRMTAPESEGICTVEPRAPSTSLQPGLQSFQALCCTACCNSAETQSVQPWDSDLYSCGELTVGVERQTAANTEVDERTSLLQWGNGKGANLSEQLPINESPLLSVKPFWRRKQLWTTARTIFKPTNRIIQKRSNHSRE